MCLTPIYVTIRPKVYQIGDFQGKSYSMPVPCGQCSQCLKKRQGQYRSRVILNSQKYPYCYFVTLTYNEDNVPIYCVPCQIDKETGELIKVSDENNSSFPACLSRDLPLYGSCRSRLNGVEKSLRCRSFYEDLSLPFDYDIRFFYTDSLDYSDVQKFLKRLRSKISYYMEDAPKLSYLICGEYGPVTHRPHYHLLLMFGKPVENILRYVRESWDLGYIDLKPVSCTSQDFGKVGSYISKYLVKGKKNDEPAAKDGFCVRPRVRSSIGFGSWLSNNQISYLRCYDLYGPYSMFEPENILNDEKKKETLFTEMAKRFQCLFASSATPVTKSLLKRLFAVRSPSGNYFWSPLYLAFRDFTREYAVSRNDQLYRQYCSNYGYAENTLDSFLAFERYKKALADFANAKFEASANAFYKRSKC